MWLLQIAAAIKEKKKKKKKSTRLYGIKECFCVGIVIPAAYQTGDPLPPVRDLAGLRPVFVKASARLDSALP